MTATRERQRTPLKRKTRLRPVSKKRAAVNAQRRDFVREQLAKRRWCEAGPLIAGHLGQYATSYANRDGVGASIWMRCGNRSKEMHEPLTRARAPGAETILDEANSVAICSACHRWVHDHPAEATRLGLLRSAHAG